MKLAVLAVCLLAGTGLVAEAGQRARQPRSGSSTSTTAASSNVADAYAQYLLGRHLERAEDIDGAIAAYKRAAALDPSAGDVLAELSALYMRQNRIPEAISAAEQALKITPGSDEAHRVLGTIYAALSDTETRSNRGRPSSQSEESAAKGIEHLEQAVRQAEGEPDANALANLARLYVRTRAYDKAIPILKDLVVRERGWQDGVNLLAEAYSGANKSLEAIEWLEQAAEDDPRLYATLGDFYDRERRWKDSATAYAMAIENAPRNVDLKMRYASALLNVGDRENVGKARDVLNQVITARPMEQRALYLLAQAERRSGDTKAAEATARRLITLNGRSPWGYYALAEVLQDRQQFQAIIDALGPAVNEMRTRSAGEGSGLSLLLPHLGYAYEQLGRYDAALAAFEEAHRLAPDDDLITSYLIQANLSAKKYSNAIDLAEKARSAHPDDLRLARLHAQALRQNGQPDRAVDILQDVLKRQSDRPLAYVSLAQAYNDANRGADAVKLLEEAQTRFPSDTSIPFELGAVLEKQKRFADAEVAFKEVLRRDPDHAPALNYLGYMLADRGERLDESVEYLKRALAIDPDNGSYLDSLGWAYYKSNKFDLAADNLKRAAQQLTTNSVIQDHYGELLFKMGRYDEAIEAWTRALNGDGDSIDRSGIDKKIRSAQQKLGRK